MLYISNHRPIDICNCYFKSGYMTCLRTLDMQNTKMTYSVNSTNSIDFSVVLIQVVLSIGPSTVDKVPNSVIEYLNTIIRQ